MNYQLLKMAQKANKACVDPVVKIDPRFLNAFTEEVMQEIVNVIGSDDVAEKVRKHIFKMTRENC